MKLRLLLLVNTFALMTQHAFAEGTITCQDAKKEVSLQYHVIYKDEKYQVTKVKAKVDFGISTDPKDPDYSGETIDRVEIQNGMTQIRVVANGMTALKLQAFHDVQGRDALMAGILSIEGGGLWAVTCQGWQDAL